MLHPFWKPLNWDQFLSIYKLPSPTSDTSDINCLVLIEHCSYIPQWLFQTIAAFLKTPFCHCLPFFLVKTLLFTLQRKCQLWTWTTWKFLPYSPTYQLVWTLPHHFCFNTKEKNLAFCCWWLILRAIYLIPSALISLDTSSRGLFVVLLSTFFSLFILYPANLQIRLLWRGQDSFECLASNITEGLLDY